MKAISKFTLLPDDGQIFNFFFCSTEAIFDLYASLEFEARLFTDS